MLQRLIPLIANQPRALADHAAAYTDLLAAEARQAFDSGRRLALLYAAALCCAAVAAVLAGVALMLWAVVPADAARAAWVLVAVPLLPTIGALACVMAARAQPATDAFDSLRQQVQADLAVLREASAP